MLHGVRNDVNDVLTLLNICFPIPLDIPGTFSIRSNFSYCHVLQENIKNISGKEISNLTNIKKGDNFLLAGCPPCQGFSNIGKRNIADEKNELVYDYVRIVHELMPSFLFTLPSLNIFVKFAIISLLSSDSSFTHC